MGRNVWQFELEDGNHTVELEHGYFSSKRIISVDGVEVERHPANYYTDLGSEHSFRVAGVSCALRIRPDWRFLALKFKYELYVGGSLVNTEKAHRNTLH